MLDYVTQLPTALDTLAGLRQATSEPTLVPVKQIHAADSPRLGGLDREHVRCLADAGADLPPILVHRGTMRVIDGMHRLSAALLRGQDLISVRFFDGDADDTFLLAVESNIRHGLPLKLEERRAAASRILRSHPRLSDRSIGAIAGLAAKTVAGIRASLGVAPVDARVGRDGRVRPLSSADGRRLAGAMFAREPDASLRRVARSTGISLGTARDVRERVRRGEDATLPRQRERSPARSNGTVASRRTAEGVDLQALMRQLYRDPALRYSERGRSLLQWLDGRVVGLADWPGRISDLPPHCAIVVARMARASALAWSDFADALDERVRELDESTDEGA